MHRSHTQLWWQILAMVTAFSLFHRQKGVNVGVHLVLSFVICCRRLTHLPLLSAGALVSSSVALANLSTDYPIQTGKGSTTHILLFSTLPNLNIKQRINFLSLWVHLFFLPISWCLGGLADSRMPSLYFHSFDKPEEVQVLKLLAHSVKVPN